MDYSLQNLLKAETAAFQDKIDLQKYKWLNEMSQKGQETKNQLSAAE